MKNRIANRPGAGGALGLLVLGVVLLLSGGVALAADESPVPDRGFQVTQPEIMQPTPPKMLGISEPKILKSSEPKMLKVSEPKSLKVSEPKILEPATFPKGEYSPPEPEYPAYDRCAQKKGFDAQLECARTTMGLTAE